MIIGICKYCKKSFRKREQKYKFCSLYCSNNFNKNGLIKVVLPQWSNQLAEFVGICLGDGNVSRYQVCISLNSIVDKEYIPYVRHLIHSIFPEIKTSTIQKKEQAVELRINSRIVADFFYNMGIIPHNKKIPTWIFTSPTYIKFCVRGLFDTEGSISFKTYLSKKGTSVYKQLNFTNYDKNLVMFVRDTLKGMGLKPTMSLTKSLYLSNNNSIDQFREEIGFGNPKLVIRSNIHTAEEYFNWKKLAGL
jgi:intein-encoded DNA endonuclease-like protein